MNLQFFIPFNFNSNNNLRSQFPSINTEANRTTTSWLPAPHFYPNSPHRHHHQEINQIFGFQPNYQQQQQSHLYYTNSSTTDSRTTNTTNNITTSTDSKNKSFNLPQLNVSGSSKQLHKYRHKFESSGEEFKCTCPIHHHRTGTEYSSRKVPQLLLREAFEFEYQQSVCSYTYKFGVKSSKGSNSPQILIPKSVGLVRFKTLQECEGERLELAPITSSTKTKATNNKSNFPTDFYQFEKVGESKVISVGKKKSKKKLETSSSNNQSNPASPTTLLQSSHITSSDQD